MSDWHVEYHGITDLYATIRDEENHCIAVVSDIDKSVDPNENARILAAAPMLIKALRTIASIKREDTRSDMMGAIKIAERALNEI